MNAKPRTRPAPANNGQPDAKALALAQRDGRREEGLPRGPHDLTPEEVAADQRRRLIGAMVELVGEQGYAATTVADLIEAAGISRKTFYAHFADRHELLLAAFEDTYPDALEQVKTAAQRGGGPTRRLEAVMRRLCRLAGESPGTIALSTIEIAAANPTGLQKRDRLMADYGEVIERCLQTDSDRGLPQTLTQALAGSTHRTIDAHLRAGRAERLSALAPQLARWTRSYDPLPDGFDLEQPPPRAWSAGDGLLGGRAPGTLTLAPNGYTPAGGQSKSFVAHHNREKILDAVAQLISERGYVPLTAEAIADRADISERAFLAHFKNKDDAFAAAIEIGHMKAMAIVARIRETAADWRTGVRDAVGALIEFFASEPYFTRMAFVDAPLAGAAMARRMHEHATGYTRLLLGGAPQRRRPPEVAPEAAVHGLFELAFHYAVQNRTSELVGVTREAAYLVLAPFVGVSEAAELAG
jgi:AcrR family transcriptional regulator